MDRFFIQLEYNGTKYHGFQKQSKTTKTIQYYLDKALTKIANHKVITTCCGRTDSGVHALNQFVHFDTNSLREIDAWVNGVNANLPDDIAVKNFYKLDKFELPITISSDIAEKLLNKKIQKEEIPMSVKAMYI